MTTLAEARSAYAEARALDDRITREDREATRPEQAQFEALMEKVKDYHERADVTAAGVLRAAIWRNYSDNRGRADHEAGHAIAMAAEGGTVHRVFFEISEGRVVGAGVDGTPAPGGDSAIVGIAGRVGARLGGHRGYYFGTSESDEKILAAAFARTGENPPIGRQRAERQARNLLLLHAKPFRLIAEALMASGALEGAELDRLLAPVRQRALAAA